MNKNPLTKTIKNWAIELGFSAVGITDLDVSLYRESFHQWLEHHYEGGMRFMRHHLEKRLDPKKLLPTACRAICVAMPYLTPSALTRKLDRLQGYMAHYALGDDYHRLIRKKLQQLANKIQEKIGAFTYRAFSDSAPLLERALAEKAGIGWIGKNTCLIHREMGSYFFLGELLVDLDLPIDKPGKNHCGTCQQCLTHCPTKAIRAPYVIDARKCIAYLTIEHPGEILEKWHPFMGNTLFGCDACQSGCPWNRKVLMAKDRRFTPRPYFLEPSLHELSSWNEAEFLEKTRGSPIRRLGFERWQRNISIALKNSSLR